MTDGIDGLALRVAGARKRDAGRGIARLPQHVQSQLGVLSGDPVLIEGADLTVAKVWPGDESGDVVRIDADTRADAGTTIGETVSVRRASVEDAVAVTIQPADENAQATANDQVVRNRLVDRILRPGKRIRLQGLGAFVVSASAPSGSVRVTDETDVTVDPAVADPDEFGSLSRDATAGAEPESPDAGATTYEDIGGLDQELDLVREMVELPLAEPELFGRLGIDPPTGVLLHGPPGTGKTLIARAVANEVDAYFDTISGPEIVSKYKGESEERLREAFDRAADNAPAILFVDEIDSIAGARDEEADMENRVVAQLLTLMDGLEERDRVVVIGATNRVDAVDPALRRGGRFDREIEVGVPDEVGRREILDVHARGVPLGDDVDLDRIAARTHGFVGADLATLVREAAMAALRSYRETPVGEDADGESAGAADTPTDTADLHVDRAAFETAMAAIEPSAMREYVSESPTVTFDDVGGLDDAKARLREAVQWPLEYGPLFDAAKTDPPSGVLLHGPSGTGKTLLARAIAGESGVNFVRVAGPEILDRYVGQSEEAIRELFDRARQTAPAIVFIDEIDAVAGQRGEVHEVTERVVSQLLTELDTSAENPQLLVVAATNRKDALDPALLRPGRLERHVHVPAPDEAARREILAIHTAEKPLGADVDLDALAAETEDVSGADLAAIVRDASMRAIREVAEDVDPADAADRRDDVVLRAAHFDAARVDGVRPDGR